MIDHDHRFMEQVLALAALGEGTASPNPRVGCLVVKEGRVLAGGFHVRPGQPHAEAMALGRAGEAARGATLYVNLEPCSHHGRTPPCAERIASAGVRRVVASIQDPNPQVNGSGFEALREAGVEVSVGLLRAEAAHLNAAFLRWQAGTRPMVTLKAAVTSDGMLAAAGGESRWITDAPARRFAHRLRYAHDAVLVGAGTVRRDDPRLTVRLPGVEAPAKIRAILAPRLDLDPGARIFDRTAPSTRIYVSRDLPAEAERPFGGIAEIVRVPGGEAGLDLGAVLDDLGREGAQSLLVEGGGKTHGHFLSSGLADRAAIFVSHSLLGARGGTPFLDADSVTSPAAGWRIEGARRYAMGRDLLVTGAIHGGA